METKGSAMTQIKTTAEVKAELDALRAKKNSQKKSRRGQSRDHFGLIHLDPDGYCRVFHFQEGEEQAICLGRSIEVIPYIRDQGIDPNDLDGVMTALGRKALADHAKNCRGNHHQKAPVSPTDKELAIGNTRGQGFTPTVPSPIVTGARNRLKCLSEPCQGLVKAETKRG